MPWRTCVYVCVSHRYLSHPELQGMAMRVLEELVLSSPHLRNQVVVGVAAHCVALPDDSMRVSEILK